MKSHHGDLLAVEHTQGSAHFKGLLYPHFIVGLVGGGQHFETALAQNRRLFAFGGKSQIDIGFTANQFVTNRDFIACRQSELGLEQMQIFLGYRTRKTQTRTSHVGIVECELGFQTVFHYLVGSFAHKFRSEPPPPCGQIILHTDVVPLVVVLAFAHPIEELPVTQVEVSDERFFGKIPFERTARRHESRHTEPVIIGVMIAAVVNLYFIDGITVAVGKELLDQMLIVRLLGDIGASSVGTVGPQHVIIVRSPQSDRDIVILE